MSMKHSFLPDLIMHAVMILSIFEVVPFYGMVLSDLFEPVANALILAQTVA